MSFYDQVLRELIVAIGGALLVGNVLALLRRRGDGPEAHGAETAARVRDATTQTDSDDLVQAPVVRTLLFAALGLVMLVAGIAALVSG